MISFAERIHMVGLGGIGSKLVDHLLQFLAHEKFKGEVLLWDGDKYEDSNKERQNFPLDALMANKAAVHAALAQERHPDLTVIAREEFVDKHTVRHLVRENQLIFSCVDNHPCRVLIERSMADVENLAIITAGNELIDGNVHVYLRTDGEDMTLSLLERHPEVAEGTDGERNNEDGCEALVSKGQTQLMVTNLMAATMSMAVFHALWAKGKKYGKLKQEVLPQDVYFDVRQLKASVIEVA